MRRKKETSHCKSTTDNLKLGLLDQAQVLTHNSMGGRIILGFGLALAGCSAGAPVVITTTQTEPVAAVEPVESMADTNRSFQAGDQFGTVLDQTQASGSVGIVDLTGKGEDLAVFFHGVSGGNQGPGFFGRLNDKNAPGKPCNQPIASGEGGPVGGKVQRKFADQSTLFGDFFSHLQMLFGMDTT